MFGAICGSSLATVATMGRIAFPELKSRGCVEGLAVATIVAAGTIGVMTSPSVLLTIPSLSLLAASLDIDMVWFGVLIVTAAEIARITLPVGMNLLVVQQISGGVPQMAIVGNVLPFVLTDVLRVALLIAFPAIALFLLSTMGS